VEADGTFCGKCVLYFLQKAQYVNELRVLMSVVTCNIRKLQHSAWSSSESAKIANRIEPPVQQEWRQRLASRRHCSSLSWKQTRSPAVRLSVINQKIRCWTLVPSQVPLCGTAERTVQTAQPAASNVDWITGPTVQCLQHYGNSSGGRFGLCCSVSNLLPLSAAVWS